MELNLQIQQLGQIDDVCDFYKFLSQNVENQNSVLLESVAENTQSMLFSFIGINPDFMVKLAGDQLSIFDVRTEKGELMKDYCDTYEPPVPDYQMPFTDKVPMAMPALDAIKGLFPVSNHALPDLFPRRIFSGGLCGYVGYDVVAPFVGYSTTTTSQEQFPDVLMGLFTTVLAYAHNTHALYQIDNTLHKSPGDDTVANVFDQYHDGVENRSPMDFPDQNRDANDLFQSNTTPDQWEEMLNITKEHLAAGDIIQAVIARKMVAESKVPPLTVYQALRSVNPSPYMFYLNFPNTHNGDIRLIGSSPEALITKDHLHLETVPIAGTRRRGRTPEDEERMTDELLNDEKENAEHIMLVDLARNDLARVSVPGTVETYELKQLRKYPHVMHLISKVRATSHLDPVTVLKSLFPAGTVSGAPKKRAMEIIHSVEREDRGPYAGCVGYLSFAGNMDMAISIRTIFNKDTTYVAQAGAGIVADSVPRLEYMETANKMKGVLAAIASAEASYQ